MENGKEHRKRRRFFAIFIFALLTCIVFATPFFIIAAVDPHHDQHEVGGGDEIDVTGLSGLLADAQKVAVSKNSGAIIGTRAELNFIEGSNITMTITDDAVNDEVDIEIEATGGGGGAPVDATYVVFEADATLTQEKILGTQVIVDGLDADMPLAGVEGRLYWATDTKKFYRDNGASWDFILSLDHALLSNLTTGDPHTQYQLEVQKGVANGYASLDAGATIPLAEIPASITRDSEWNTEGEVEAIWGLDIFTSGDGALDDDDLSDNSIEALSDVTTMTPNDNDVLTWDAAGGYWEAVITATISHASSHENGGADEISVGGLSGQLADCQTPCGHNETHMAGGDDEMNLDGMVGILAEAQNADELQGRAVQDHDPLDTEVLTWVTANSQWEPAAGGGGVADLNEAYEGGSAVTVDVADVIWDLTSTQDFVVKDNGTQVFAVTDAGKVDINAPATVDNSLEWAQTYTGTTLYSVGIKFDRTISSIAQTAVLGGLLLELDLLYNTNVAAGGGGGLWIQSMRGMQLKTTCDADVLDAQAGGSLLYTESLYGFASDTGGDSDTAIDNTRYTQALNFIARATPTVDKNTKTLTSIVKGVNMEATLNPVITSGTFVGKAYGIYAKAQGTTEGTQTAYGIYATATGADTNYSGYFVGNVYVGGKITAVGGVDPPYVLYDYETRESIIERVMREVAPEKLDGAIVFYNGETGGMEMFIPASGEFQTLYGFPVEKVDPIKETFKVLTMYRFDANTGEVVSYQAPVQDEWLIKEGVSFDNMTGKFYEVDEETGVKTDREVTAKDAIEYKAADDTGITPVEPKP